MNPLLQMGALARVVDDSDLAAVKRRHDLRESASHRQQCIGKVAFRTSLRRSVEGPLRQSLHLQDAPVADGGDGVRVGLYGGGGGVDLKVSAHRTSVLATACFWRPFRGRDHCQRQDKTTAACTAPVFLDLAPALVLRLGAIYPQAPVGNWGYLMTEDELVNELMGATE